MQYPKLIESRTSGGEVLFVEWNPSMDLLATVFKDGLLTCSRLLSFKKKVWHKQYKGAIKSIAWRPDGRVLAVASENRLREDICTLHDVENGNEIHSIIFWLREITSISWSQYNQEIDQIPLIQPDSETKKFNHQLAHEQTRLNLLIISTKGGAIDFYALGLFFLGNIYGSYGESTKIASTHLSSCLRYISTVSYYEYGHKPPNAKALNFITLRVMKFNILNDRSNEILRIAKLYSRITDELEYLDDTINAMTTSWADVLAGLDNKLSSYTTRGFSCHHTLLSSDELLQLLVIGFPSDNLEKFLTDISDKGLKKLNNAIEQTCLRVQGLNVKNAQKCCYHLHGDLNLLRGMALWRERFQDLGLDEKAIIEAMRSVGTFLLKLTELQQVTDHSLKSTKSFFRWLISIACRITGEQNSSPNDINKTTQQDIQLITSFINENFDKRPHRDDKNEVMSKTKQQIIEERHPEMIRTLQFFRPTYSNFTLEQVGQYFKNEYLSTLKYSFAKPGSNFWVEFCNSRPELLKPNHSDADGSPTLLFYPHNLDTSLIQEYKTTRKSIEAAFKTVPQNIDLSYNSLDSLMSLKNFIPNAPANRIRVETDLSYHYTLFQTKHGRVSRQHLISQSLDDKSFKLISIGFESKCPEKLIAGSSKNISATDRNLWIVDSCFYEDKESRKMLLSFLLLDETGISPGNTIIVQVELIKLLESHDVELRNIKDAGKIFRNCDSIIKNSTPIVLKIDITTEPAHERKHGSELMVKKIIGIAGQDMFASSGRGVMAFTSLNNKRLHLYELENISGAELIDDELEIDEKIDDSFIYPDMAG